MSIIRWVGAIAVLTTSLTTAASAQYVNAPVSWWTLPIAPAIATYVQTIRFIDDGIRYADAEAAFFVSPDSRMCFRKPLNLGRTIFDELTPSDWCLFPTAIGSVVTIPSLVTGEEDLQISCGHWAPQCVRELGYWREANVITMKVYRPQEEKAAVAHLIYLMGGYPPWALDTLASR